MVFVCSGNNSIRNSKSATRWCQESGKHGIARDVLPDDALHGWASQILVLASQPLPLVSCEAGKTHLLRNHALAAEELGNVAAPQMSAGGATAARFPRISDPRRSSQCSACNRRAVGYRAADY